MKPFIKSLKFLTLLSVVFLFNACQDDDTELPVIEASFTHTIDADTGKVTFINTSSNADTFTWDFGDGSTSTEINPMKIYGTGTYTVTLTARNAAGATDTFEDVITINIPVPVSLPFNFDGANVVYNYDVFNGVSFAIVDNPAPSGSNSAASQVGAITNSGANWEGMYFDLENEIDLMNDMTIKFDFWADTPVTVLLKLEEGTAGPVETTASHTGSSEWEELTFTFNSTNKYNRMTIFVDGPGTTPGTFYIDNFRQTATVDLTPPVITLVGDNPLNLNVGDTYADPGATAMDDTDGDITSSIVVGGDTVDTSVEATYTVTYNVMDAAGNPATEVTRAVVVSALPTAPTSGAPAPTQNAANVTSVYSDAYTDIGTNYDPNWGQSGHNQVNTTFDPGDGNNTLAYPNFNYQGTEVTASDLSAMEFLHVDIWVAAGTDRMVKVSPINGGTGAGEFLVEVPLTPGSWNSVDLPKSAFTGMTWDNVVQMKFDGQFNGDGSANTTTPFDVYLDNIYFYTTTTACTDTDLEVPIDFDCAGIDYAAKIVGNVGFAVVDNPEMNGIHNVATKVGQINNAGANWENAFFNLDVPLDFNNGGEIKMKMFSNQALPIKLKLEDGTAAPTEVDANHGGTGWEELTFSFTSTDSYNDIVLFVDGPGTAAGTFYVDDITQSTSGGGGGTWTIADAVDFETGGFGASWTWNVFENGSNAPLEFVANPNVSGINTSSTVAKITAVTAGQPWVGTEVAHGQIGPFTIDASTQIVKVMVYKSVISDVAMKFATAAGAANTEIKVANTLVNQWEELTFDFSVYVGQPGGITTNLDQIIVFPDFDLSGRATDNVVYFDNITFGN